MFLYFSIDARISTQTLGYVFSERNTYSNDINNNIIKNNKMPGISFTS